MESRTRNKKVMFDIEPKERRITTVAYVPASVRKKVDARLKELGGMSISEYINRLILAELEQ